MKRILECSVLLRVYTMVMSALYGYTSLRHPETIMFHVAHSDSIAHIAAWGLCICSLFGFVDLIINDLLPPKFVLLRAIHDRHLVLMAIPICFSILMFSAVTHGYPLIILVYYGVYIFMVPASAFNDIMKRQNKKLCT